MARRGTTILVLAMIGLSLFVAGCQGQLSTIKPTPTDEAEAETAEAMLSTACLLYTSDAADE